SVTIGTETIEVNTFGELKPKLAGKSGIAQVRIGGQDVLVEVRVDGEMFVAKNGANGQPQLIDGKIGTEFWIDESIAKTNSAKRVIAELKQGIADIQKARGEDYQFWGFEKGEKNQIQYISDAILGREPGQRGTLYEAITGIGKTTTIIPSVAVLKARITGSPVVVILNTTADVAAFFKDSPPEFFAKVGQKIVEFDANSFDPANPTHTKALAEANIIVTTKDAIFESIKGKSGEPFIRKAKGAVLLADEAQNTLRLEIDYIITHGGRTRLADRPDGQAKIDLFTEVMDSATLKKLRTTLADRGLEAMLEESGIARVDGRGKVGKAEVLAESYRDLLEQAIAATEKAVPGSDAAIREYLKANGLEAGQPVTSEQAFAKFLNEIAFAGDNASALKVVQANVRERVSAFNSIVNQFAQVPGNDFTAGTSGLVVLAEGGAISGRTPSRAYDSLALAQVGYEVLSSRGVKDLVLPPLRDVSISESSIGTNYAKFLKNFSEIYGFTGTPDRVASQFDRVYGIKLGSGGVKQFDFVFGDPAKGFDAKHPIRSVVALGQANMEVLRWEFSSLVERQGDKQVTHIVNTDSSIPQGELLGFAREQAAKDLTGKYGEKGVIVIVNDPNGKHYSVEFGRDPSGQVREVSRRSLTDADALRLGDTAITSAKDFINKELATARAGGKRVYQIYEVGQHYGVDRVTLQEDGFVVFANDNTTLTDFLQGVGRDRGLNGGKGVNDYSTIDAIVRGVDQKHQGRIIDQTAIRDFADQVLRGAETRAIAQSELDALGRIAENIGFDVIGRMEEAAKGGRIAQAWRGVDVPQAALFEGLRETLRNRAELDYSIGKSEVTGKQDLLEKINRVHKMLVETYQSDAYQALPEGAKRVLREALTQADGKIKTDLFTEADLALRGDGKTGKGDIAGALNEAKNLIDYL
ncbi:hypothetical protein HY411_03110, partial [Candidatus Gottesmanbacteria bacterium]|nr:hypothetical protein [Candidatus Gottesmanbacteria bacterium]